MLKMYRYNYFIFFICGEKNCIDLFSKNILIIKLFRNICQVIMIYYNLVFLFGYYNLVWFGIILFYFKDIVNNLEIG